MLLDQCILFVPIGSLALGVWEVHINITCVQTPTKLEAVGGLLV
jgi:hypothetical protein